MPFTNRKVKYLGRYTDDPASGQTNECLVETRGCGEDSNIERGTFASCAFPPFDLLPVPLPGVCASSTMASDTCCSSRAKDWQSCFSPKSRAGWITSTFEKRLSAVESDELTSCTGRWLSSTLRQPSRSSATKMCRRSMRIPGITWPGFVCQSPVSNQSRSAPVENHGLYTGRHWSRRFCNRGRRTAERVQIYPARSIDQPLTS